MDGKEQLRVFVADMPGFLDFRVDFKLEEGNITESIYYQPTGKRWIEKQYSLAEEIEYYYLIDSAGLAYKENVVKVNRASGWQDVRLKVVKEHPYCSICNKTEGLHVHHKKPFHLWPELELSLDNLMVLCVNCHLMWGHLLDWKSYNEQIDKDIIRIAQRPYGR